MSVFVDLKAVRYSSPSSWVYYFEEKGELYRGYGKRVLKQNDFSCLKVLTLELQKTEKVVSGYVSQNPEIQNLLLAYGIPILPVPCRWREWDKKKKRR